MPIAKPNMGTRKLKAFARLRVVDSSTVSHSQNTRAVPGSARPSRLRTNVADHVMLVGEGAKQFALENGFQKTDLFTDQQKKAYQRYLEKNADQKKKQQKVDEKIARSASDALDALWRAL